jgi:transcriptional regulator with XRE-family HTH domain
VTECWAKAVGAHVRWLRERAGLRQRDLAELADMERPNLSSIESGRRHPSVPTLLKIAQGLGVPPSAVFVVLDEWQENAK